MASYCSENSFFITFLYLLAYFVGILLVLHFINLCGPLDKLVANLGEDAYHYWMTYELKYSSNLPKQSKTCRCIKVKLTRLENPDGRNIGFLQKLGNGKQFSMGSTGRLYPNGIGLSLCGCLTCGLCSCCKCCTCYKLPPGLLEDFLYYVFNNHGFLSTFCAEKDNPYSRTERNFAFFGLGCLTFFGNVMAQVIGFSEAASTVVEIAFIGFLNFLLTNVFQVLFSCTFLFNATDAHRTETKLHFLCRKFFSWIGSILGILLALGIGLFFLLISSAVCGGRGNHLLSFTLSSQLVGIGLDFLYIVVQYFHVVVHVKNLPCIGKKTLCGAWYRERYLYHCYTNPYEFFANPAVDQPHRKQKGPITKAPVYQHEVVQEAHLLSSALEGKKEIVPDGDSKNFRYIQINFCKLCCCSCICCPYVTCTINRDEESTEDTKLKKSKHTNDNFDVLDIY